MRKRWLWSTTSVLGLVLLVPLPTCAQQQPAGVVTGLQGQAQLTRPATAPTPLRFKDGVIIRDVVSTREKSLARILFGGRSTVTVRELTRLEVREELLPTGARRDVHDLSSGTILVNVARQLMRPGDEVVIRTPNAIAAVRGSTLFASFNPVLNQSFFALLSGSGLVTPQGQTSVTLTPNTGLNITGTGPTVQAGPVQVITQAQATQIVQESQVAKVVKEEANKEQSVQVAVKEAAALVTAVVEAVTKTEQTTGETKTEEQKKEEQKQEPKDTKSDTTTTAPITPETSTADNPDVEISNTSKTLTGSETLKTFSGSGSRSGTSPVVKITDSTVNRASTGNLVQVDSGADWSISSQLLQIVNGTISDSRLLEVKGTLKGSGTSPFIDVSGGSLTLGANNSAILVNSPATLDVKGALFKAKDTTITPGSGVPFMKIAGASTLSAAGSFLDLTNVNLDLGTQVLARVEGGSTFKNTAGPGFKITGGSLKADALVTTDGAGNTLDITGTILDLTNTTVTVRTLGEDPTSSTDTDKFTPAANEALLKLSNSTLKLTGTDNNELIALNPDDFGSTFKGVALVATDSSTLTLADGLLTMDGTFESKSTSPLVQLTDSTVDDTANLIAVMPGSTTDITLAGQLLKASGSTIKVKNKDKNTLNTTATVGTKPFDVVFAGERAYVVNFSSGTVSVINTRTNTVEKTLTVGSSPTSIAREGSDIYVTNAGSNTVSRIDAISRTVTNTISVGGEPHDVTILPNGDKAYVTNFSAGTVSVIRTSDNTVIKTITVGSGPDGIGFTPDGKKVGVLNQNSNNLSVIDTATDTVAATIAVGTKPVDAVTGLKNNRAYVANEGSDNVSVINTSNNTLVATVAAGDGPHAVAITPDDKKVYVANKFSNNVSVIDTSNNTVVATVAVGTAPGSIDISPDGKRAYVANFDSNNISVIDTGNNTVIATVNVGTGPGTIALTRGGSRAFVLNETTNNVSVVDTIDLGNFLAITGGAILKSTSSLPLLEFNPSTIELGGRLVNIRDSGSKLDLAGPLVKATDTDFTIRGILRVRDGGVLTSSTTEPLMKFVGTAADKSKVDTLSDSISIDQQDTTDKAPQVTLAGPLLQATKTTFTAGKDSINKSNFILVADGGLLKSTGTDPLITFDGSTLDPSQRFLGVWSPDAAGTGAKVQVAGPLLVAKNSSSFKTGADFITIEDKATLKGTGTTALVQSTGSTFNIGSELQGFGSFLRLNDNTTVSQEGPAVVDLAGPLISDSGSTFDIFTRFLYVIGGSTLTSTSSDPLIQLSGSTVDTGTDFVHISGSGSKITLSGSLLKAGSTLNIGTNSSFSGDLLEVSSGGQLVMNSSSPVVELTGGTHTIGTADTTSNNTPNRLFRLVGVNTDSSTGLGTDQPIKGNGTDPAPFTGASHPIGTLLKATDAATIEVKKGSGDTSGGNAVRIDTALYEATLPILDLVGSSTTETTLKTAQSTIDIFKSKVVSLGPVVAMDKSFINVTNGAFINLTGGTEWKVTGDLLKLFNGAKIEVINGPLIFVSGTSSSGSSPPQSLLDVSGALVNFGGTGSNKIIVNNSLCSGACVTKGGSGAQAIQVKEGSTGSITIGSNPIKNTSLGSIQYQGSNTALIQTGSTGKVNITAP